MNRLFEIVFLLLEKKTMTAPELAAHFGVSVRTIYRDIEALSVSGIPVYTLQGRSGGILLMDQFVLNKSLLTEEEQNQLLFAVESLAAFGKSDGEKIISKLRGMFQRTGERWISVDFSRWGFPQQDRELFQKLQEAVIQKREILFDYFNASGEQTHRRVRPFRLLFKDKAWYLQAMCLIKQEPRVFKLTRMENLEVTNVVFCPAQEYDFFQEEDWQGKLSYETVRLWVSEKLAYRVWDEFDRQQIKRREDGSFEVTALMPEDSWLYGYILSFGPYMKVLEPKRIQDELRRLAKEIGKLYET